MGRVPAVLGVMLLVFLLMGTSPAGAVLIDFEYIGYNVPYYVLYGGSNTTTDNLIIEFSADSGDLATLVNPIANSRRQI